MSIQSHVRAQSSWIVLLDIGCLLISSLLAIAVRFWHEDAMVQQYVYGHLNGWVMFFGSVIVANYLAGSYRVQYSISRFNLIVTWLFSISFATFVLALTYYAWMMKVMLGRGVLLLSVVFYSSFSLFLRLVAYRALFSHGFLMKQVVIIGSGTLSSRLRNYLENPYILPQHRVVAWLKLLGHDQPHSPSGEVVDNIPVVETSIDNMGDVILGLGANMVVLGQEQSRDLSPTYPQLRKLRFKGVEIMSPLVVAELYTGRSPLDFLDEDTMMLAGIESSWPIVWRTKRIIDIFVSLFGGILLLPLVLLIIVILKLADPRGKVFYVQDRVGQFGKIFRIHKFRTMREGAEDASGAVWADDNDPRITRIGRILRKFRLDEIPQFWNIFKGDMSLVGPRPERPEIVADLARQIPFYDEREYAMPGLTGWAQIQYPYGSSIEDASRKLEYDLFYIKNLSLSLDLQIVLRTLRIVILGKERD